jgi:2-haloalkanoic acid dehalogenase type II
MSDLPTRPPEMRSDSRDTPNDGIRAIAFDCYGTLIDFTDGAFIQTYDDICRRQGLGCDGKALWDKWMDIWRRQAAQGRARENPRNEATAWTLSRPSLAFRPYSEEWPEHFETCFRELGVRGDPMAAYEHVRVGLAEASAYGETWAVLAALKRRYRLGILSNADDDFLTACLQKNSLHTEFEIIVTSESAGVYKPHEEIFHSFCEAAGVARHEVLYVGDSQSADVLGAKNAGMPMAWVNRDRSPLREGVPRPDHEIASLADLLDLLG